MAILAERFYVIGRTFLWHKNCRSTEISLPWSGGPLIRCFFLPYLAGVSTPLKS